MLAYMGLDSGRSSGARQGRGDGQKSRDRLEHDGGGRPRAGAGTRGGANSRSGSSSRAAPIPAQRPVPAHPRVLAWRDLVDASPRGGANSRSVLEFSDGRESSFGLDSSLGITAVRLRSSGGPRVRAGIRHNRMVTEATGLRRGRDDRQLHLMGAVERRRLRPGTTLGGARLEAVMTTAAGDATPRVMTAGHVQTGVLNGRRAPGGQVVRRPLVRRAATQVHVHRPGRPEDRVPPDVAKV